jgi:hypothetical protein
LLFCFYCFFFLAELKIADSEENGVMKEKRLSQQQA